MSMAELRVALDIGCKKHRIAIGTADGRVLEEFDITHDKGGFAYFFRRVETRREELSLHVVVAMEGLGGWARPLDRMIQQQGYELLNVNNVKLARFKEIFAGPAKTDKIDTRKILELMHLREALPLANRVLHRVGLTPMENEQLKRFTRRRRQVVDEKIALSNRLSSDLQAISPGLLEITGDIDNLWFLNFLSSREDLRKLGTLRRSSLLKIKGVGNGYAAKIECWQKTATFADEAEWVSSMVITDVQRMLELLRQIRDFDERIEQIASTSAIAVTLRSITGFGPVCSATLAGEIGNIDRFASESSLALYLGMTRLDNSSGNYVGTKNTRQVNTHAREAMMTASARHMQHTSQSRRYYEKKIADGKTHNQAVRALGRHLVRVIWSMIKNDRPYFITD
jgi:transposase